MNKYEVIKGNTEFVVNSYFKEKRVQRVMQVFFDRYKEFCPTIEEDFNEYLKVLEKNPDVINIFILENQIKDLEEKIKMLKTCSKEDYEKIYE